MQYLPSTKAGDVVNNLLKYFLWVMKGGAFAQTKRAVHVNRGTFTAAQK